MVVVIRGPELQTQDSIYFIYNQSQDSWGEALHNLLFPSKPKDDSIKLIPSTNVDNTYNLPMDKGKQITKPNE